MKHNSIRLLAVVILALAGALPAMMIEVPAPEVLSRADAVVTGTVTSVTSRWDETRTMILTDVEIRSEKLDKGHAPTSLTLRLPGGEVGELGLAVEDIPTFRVGERTTVALTHSDRAGIFLLFGAYQGKLAGEPGRSTDGIALYSYTGYHRASPSCNYYINATLPADWVSALSAAGATWSAAGSAFRFNYQGTAANTGPTYDGVNIIWRSNLGSGGILAQNSYWYNRKTKIVYENDIVFNTYYVWSTSGAPGAYDVQNIGTHEMGHSLVLNDLYRSAQAEQTMYGYGAAGETKKRSLESGDIAGIKTIYGAGFDRIRNRTKAMTTVSK